MSGRRAAEAETLAAQSQELLTGFDALLRIEHAICGSAVARQPAVAEGLALSGVPAASLSREPAPAAGDRIALGDGASCVHHVRGAPGRDGAGAFELAAASVQEAVDHCVVAHLVSRRLGRAGVCSLVPSLAAGLSLVRLPGPELVAALLLGEDGPPELEAQPDRIVEIARAALRRVAERTGRPADVVDLQADGATSAEVVLVAAGGDAALARDAAGSLREVGTPAAALAVHLVRPFPEEDVRRALSGARIAFVLTDAGQRSALLAHVRAAVAGATEVRALPSASPARLLGSLAAQLPGVALDPERHAPLLEPLRRRLVVAPAGPWGEETARSIAAALGQLGPLRVATSTRRHLGATVLAWNGGETPGGKGDLLVVAHPALLRERGTLALVRTGALLVLSDASSSEELAALLEPDARRLLHERDLAVYRVPPPEAESGDRAASFALAGAALVALAGPDPAEAHARSLEAAGCASDAGWLRHGAREARRLEHAELDPARHAQEVDFRPAPKLPRMPEAVDDAAEAERWSERIRRFHRSGRAEFGTAPQLPMRPAALGSVAAGIRETAMHPFALVHGEDAKGPIAGRGLRDLLVEGTAALQEAGRPARVLADNAERLGILAGQLLAQKAPGVRLGDLLSESGRALVELLGLPEEEAGTLTDDLDALRHGLPEEAPVLELRADTPLRVYLEVLEAVRSPLRRRFAAELEELRERLADLLRLDRMRSTESRSPDAVAARLGRAGSEYLDPAALARTLPGRSGSEALGPERRRRIEDALVAIERYLEPAGGLPSVVLLHPPGLHLGVPEVESREHPSPLAAAVGAFDGLARRLTAVLRAARVARLEVNDAYRPELHDELLDELDWQGFSAQELRLMPAVAVVTTGRSLRERDQGPLSQLLRSSRPVHVLVHDEVGAPDEAQDLSRFHLDLGYLVMAHREALAAGSTLARPDRLVDGLVRAASALRPAVALVSLPAPEPAYRRALLADAALQGRACPDFRYDPDAGPSWADRFDLDGNPQPERAWPLHRVGYLEDGAEQSMEVAFTFADAVALEPAYLRHLRTIPRAAWSEEQLPLADYLDRFEPEARERGIPYIWVVDQADTLQRAVVTRELAMACGDRLRAWRVLQELAGFQNVFARRAAEAAREEALKEAETQRVELEQAHEQELERVRREGAQESMERLAAALMSSDALPLATSTPLPSAPRPAAAPAVGELAAEPAAAAAAEPVVVEAPPEEEALSFDEPYIDTPLCTTCNECTNLNAQLFQYNAEKQAFIADAAAGTFAELVKAAELCPARCIHPGKPRSDDATATPELIARAAAFNG
jgi:ferredoxin